MAPPFDLPLQGFAFGNFRTLQDVEFVCRGPVTVFCGPNNTGKSSLLRAVEVAYSQLVALATGADSSFRGRVDDSNAFPEAPRVAIDPRGPRFRSIFDSLGDAGDEFTQALYEELQGPIWIRFATRRNDQLVLDAKESFRPIAEVVGRWRQSARRTWADALQTLGGTHQSQSPVTSWIPAVARECLVVPTVRFIPDVRWQAEAPLAPDELWALAQASSRTTGLRRKERWADALEEVLQDVFGADVTYTVHPQDRTGDFRLRIDGQDEVSLDHVGAGVREVVAIGFAALSGETSTLLCVEEPENCLHPRAARRLVRSLAERANVQLLISTHSAAVVNADPHEVIHLVRAGAETRTRQVTGPASRYEAVRSLGYSPSDLVLTPCAVWVEGPSDRVYLVAWLRSLGLIEGVDYQVMFYGGSLAAHVTTAAEVAAAALTDQDLAAIRNLGRRCVVVVDSDKDRASAGHKRHVKRFSDELAADDHAYLFITWGREVENYVPLEVVNQVRKERGVRPLKPGDYRYERVVDTALLKKMTKVAFARRVLAIAGDEPPPAAVRDVRRLSVFIRAGVPA